MDEPRHVNGLFVLCNDEIGVGEQSGVQDSHEDCEGGRKPAA